MKLHLPNEFKVIAYYNGQDMHIVPVAFCFSCLCSYKTITLIMKMSDVKRPWILLWMRQWFQPQSVALVIATMHLPIAILLCLLVRSHARPFCHLVSPLIVNSNGLLNTLRISHEKENGNYAWFEATKKVIKSENNIAEFYLLFFQQGTSINSSLSSVKLE